jgi:hypothetical protein
MISLFKKPEGNDAIIKKDVLRYKKNKLASNLALLALVCDCIYFIVLYAQVKNDGFYYKWSIAFDVIYNLFFMLFTFLFSEEVKNYRSKYTIFQTITGALQIGRAFWLPLTGYLAGAITVAAYVVMMVALIASGVLQIASACIGFIRAKSLEAFTKQLENGEVDLDAVLKEESSLEGDKKDA